MSILDLPAELIAQIFVFMDDQDVFSARLSNKTLEKASFAYFGKHFFRKKGFMITTPSLSVLQEIADHEELRKYVQHLWFNPDCYTFAHPECCPEDDEAEEDEDEEDVPKNRIPQDPAVANQYKAYSECMSDHFGLLNSDRLERRLTAILRRLPNVETIGMRRSEEYSPYGWHQLQEAIGEDPRVLGPIPSGPVYMLAGPTQLFTAVISAVATTGIKLERLYTDAIELDNIKPDVLSTEKLQAACSSVLYVELNVVKAWLNKHPKQSLQTYDTLRDPSDFGSNLVSLFKSMPKLKEIGLQIFPDRKQSHLLAPTARNPESWRQSYPYISLLRLANEVQLPHLTRVKLEKFTTTSTILQALLKPSAANLTSLKIRDIRLLSSEEEPRPWQTFFHFLTANCPELDYVLFYHLMYDRGGVSYVEEAPQALPADDLEYLMDHVPSSHGGQGLFEKYDHITLEVKGKEAVKAKLEEVAERHWYHKPLFSYAMDEELWHTDTSDEEW